MKKISVLLLLILCLVFTTAALTSCLAGFELPDMNGMMNGGANNGGAGNGSANNGGAGNGGTNNGGSTTKPGDESDGDKPDGGTDEEPDNNEGEPEPEPVEEKELNVVYRYDYDGDGRTEGFYYQKILNTEGFTAEKLAEKEAIVHPEGGFGFYEFYLDSAMTQPFDFTEQYLFDVEIYCKRNMKEAGKNVTWEYSYEDATLTFTGTGDMYDFGTPEAVPWRTLCRNTVKTVVIEEGITSVAARAFHSFTNIETVEMPTTTTKIGNNAFYGSSIKYINFPKILKTIGESAFYGCEGLVELYFNKGLEQILSGAFKDCINLKAIVLTDTIFNVGVSAFQGCENIETAYYFGTEEQYNKISISLDNFWVDKLAFKYFYSAETPEKPGPYWKLNVDENEFDGEEDIGKWYYTIWYINIGEKLPFTVDYVDINEGITAENVAFLENIVHPGGYKFLDWRRANSQYGTEQFVITEGQIIRGDLKAYGNRGNLCGDNLKYSYNGSTLTIQKIDKTNPDGAMWDFTNLFDSPFYARPISVVKLNGARKASDNPADTGVTYIGKNAFAAIYDTQQKYNQFSYIEIPLHVNEIHPEAFVNCMDLLYIFYEGTDPTGCVGIDSLSKVVKGVVYYNANGVEDLSTLGAGSYYKDYGDIKSGNKRVAWTYDDENKILYVGAAGNSSHKTYYFGENGGNETLTPWYSYREEITKAVVRDNVKVIGSYTFYGLSNVVDVVVPETVTTITATAFQGTGYYTNELNENGYVCVYNDPQGGALRYGHLLKVANPENPGTVFVIPNRTLSIAKDAFENCTNITELVFTKDIKSAGIYAGVIDQLTNLEVIYFEGTKDIFESNYLSKSSKFATLNEVGKVYFYSEFKPTDTDNNYWKWSGNEPYAWTEE